MNSREQERRHLRNAYFPQPARGEISNRTEQIQSALEVQIRHLFDRFGFRTLQGQGEVQEASIVAERATTAQTTSRKWHRAVSPLRDLLGLVQTALFAIMNAIIGVFGVGVGVGLILGDSFRGNANDGNDLQNEDADNVVMVNERPSRGRGQRGQRGRQMRAAENHNDIVDPLHRQNLASLPSQ